MSREEGVPVTLYIYDLTNGLAQVISPSLIGRQVEGVWHTSVVVFGKEYFYGGAGIMSCAPGTTSLGEPLQTQELGYTQVPPQVFNDYIQGLRTSTFRGDAYHLLHHNCNHFSEELAQFLCAAHIPKHILQQPARDLPPALRAALLALLGGVRGAPQSGARADSPDFITLNDQIEEARLQSQQLGQRRSDIAQKVARTQRKKEKKRKKEKRPPGADEEEEDMAEAVEASPSEARAGPSSALLDADEREEALKRSREPPIVYKDIDGAAELEQLESQLSSVELSDTERTSLSELRQYLVGGEGSWVLGDDFLPLVGRILSDPAIPSEARVATLRSLAAAALREDVALLLHQDRRQHALLNHAHDIDRLQLPEQRATALFICNLFENVSASEWLLYISEWEYNGYPLSNIRATTKVCVHAALSEDEQLREVGTALLHNIAAKEVKTVRLRACAELRARLPAQAKSKVFDEICVELALAVLQLLQNAPPEEHMYRAARALARLCAASPSVPPLLAAVGPPPQSCRGTSPRVDEQIDIIMAKVK